MPIIYEKLPASGERCLILNGNEALSYTFDFGDWKEIRLSAFVSLTSTGLNDFPATETVITSGDNARRYYFGFKTSGNDRPYDTGTMFVGIASTDTNFSINGAFSDILAPGNGISRSGNVDLGFKAPSPNGLAFSHQSKLDTGFARFNMVVMTRRTEFSGTATFDSSYVYNNNTSSPRSPYANTFTNVSVELLKSRSNTPIREDLNYSWSGYFPPELNTVYIYYPTGQNRLRIHAILCEKIY
jgi:hypothetical protein